MCSMVSMGISCPGKWLAMKYLIALVQSPLVSQASHCCMIVSFDLLVSMHYSGVVDGHLQFVISEKNAGSSKDLLNHLRAL